MYGTRTRKVDSLDGCPRKWAAQYLEGVRPEYLAPPLVFGIKFHAVCHSMAVDGCMPAPGVLQPGVELTEEDCRPESVYGLMARQAIVYLPVLSRPWQAEQTWLFPWVTSKGVKVDIDLRPDMCADGTLIHLVDWKSTSAKRWALTSLADDVQANLYAYGLMQRFERDAVFASWIYVLKSAPHASWPLTCVFHRATCEAWLHNEIDATVDLIAALRETKPRAMDLPGDLRACDGSGRRCDFASACLGRNGPRPSLISLNEIEEMKGIINVH